MPSTQKLILAVDGGGTKTVACLVQVGPDSQPIILGRGQTGSSNLKAVGAEQALENVLLALQQAWDDCQLAAEPVALAVLALSGAGRPEAQSLLQQWNQKFQVAQKLTLVHDALPVLMAGTSHGCGVALISGTGSVAIAADSNRNTAVVGGWGYWFGDEGSAFWLGQAALRAASQVSDGRSSPTLLTKAILGRLAISDPREMLTALARNGDVRAAIAGLADLVSVTANQQDPTALQIVSQAASHLGSIVRSAAEKLDLGTAFPLVLAGGVLCESHLIRDALLEELAAQRIIPASVEIVTDPVQGCINIAISELSAPARVGSSD